MAQRPRGPQPNWRPTTPRAIGILADIIARYEQHRQEGTLPRGSRGIFYDLRPYGMGNGVTYRKPDSAHPLSGFGKMEAHPAAVQEVLVMARRAGLVREDWVADTRAPDPIVISFDVSADDEAASIAHWAVNAQQSFKLDPQDGQNRFVELWCEAADLAPRLAQIAQPYGVPVYSGAGFDGLKGKRTVAERAYYRDVPTLILHIGDRDPHGEMIYEALTEDVLAWYDARPGSEPYWLSFERLALTREQAIEHDLLDADGKAEADALPVQVLDQIVTDRLTELFDADALAELRERQRAERAALPQTIRDALAAAFAAQDER